MPAPTTELGVLFVDDEPILLRSVERALCAAEPTWSIESVSSAEHAIRLLERRSFDVVLSDLSLGPAGLNGAQLLAYVQERHPETVRIVLSGHSDPELMQRMALVAHLVLAKPFEMAELRAQLRRAAELSQLLSSSALKALVGEKHQLPTPPTLYRSVAIALSRKRTGLEEVANLIEADVAISAQLLRLVSSAFFGLPARVRTVRGAITYLGFNTVKALLLGASIVEQHGGARAAKGLDIDSLQRHALLSAHVARRIGSDSGRGDTAFSGAMLQDVGQLLLASRAPADYSRVLAQVREGRHLCEAERAVFGAAHPEVGAYLLGIWGLPQALVNAVARHHAPQREVSARLDAALAVNIATKLAEDPESAFIDLEHLAEVGESTRLSSWRGWARELTEQTREKRE